MPKTAVTKPARGVTRIKFSDWKGKKEDEGAIEIELDDGSLIRIAPPELWPDEATHAAEAEDIVGLAVALTGGPEPYQKFLAAGGSAAMISIMLKEVHGVEVGESSASSSS